jgi:hypothetical protein
VHTRTSDGVAAAAVMAQTSLNGRSTPLTMEVIQLIRRVHADFRE